MPDTTTLGKWLVVAGLALALAGGVIWLMGKFGLALGRLPGDIRIERDGFAFYLPLASSVLVSLGLTILINVVLRLLKH